MNADQDHKAVVRAPDSEIPCTVSEPAQCTECDLAPLLKCRFSRRDLLIFFCLFFPGAAVLTTGLVRGGFWWVIPAWAGYAVFFFTVWEARVLCRHCPYYANAGRMLHCIANYGIRKIWRYDPRPMSRFEQVQFGIGAILMITVPFPFVFAAGEMLLGGVAVIGVGVFVVGLRISVCPRCVNFSCPMNAVPRPSVDAYLRRNPAIRRAWENSGYRLDE